MTLGKAITRFLGSAIVGGATYFLLGFASDWNLHELTRAGIAVIVAVLLLYFGVSVAALGEASRTRSRWFPLRPGLRGHGWRSTSASPGEGRWSVL